jgi:archaemetzincin
MEPREPASRLPGSIAVWWIGEGAFDAALVGAVGDRVAREFAREVIVADAKSRPVATYDARRGQHSSRAVLTWLLAQVPAGQRVLGVTDVDLFIPVLTFVFGEAQLEGTGAVVSSARLVDHGDPGRTAWRLATEAVHELGHTFGLTHCGSMDGLERRVAPCVMSRSASVRAVDEKSERLCPDCRARYHTFEQDGTHVYRQHTDTDR